MGAIWQCYWDNQCFCTTRQNGKHRNEPKFDDNFHDTQCTLSFPWESRGTRGHSRGHSLYIIEQRVGSPTWRYVLAQCRPSESTRDKTMWREIGHRRRTRRLNGTGEEACTRRQRRGRDWRSVGRTWRKDWWTRRGRDWRSVART